jgi:hypothetical protein
MPNERRLARLDARLSVLLVRRWVVRQQQAQGRIPTAREVDEIARSTHSMMRALAAIETWGLEAPVTERLAQLAGFPDAAALQQALVPRGRTRRGEAAPLSGEASEQVAL